MNALFQSHSGLRFIVLLVGVIAVIRYLVGLVGKQPADKSVRILGSAFVGFLDLQILLGLAMVAMGRWYPALIGHLVMMLAAAGVAHTLLAINRKRPQPGFVLPLVGVGVALLLIVGGIMAIGRGPFTMTAM